MLKLSKIHIHYGKIEALKGISLELNQGEIVSLIGANGAGKSTALMAISGIIKPSKGHIEFEGKRIDSISPDAVVKLGISQVPEGRRIFPRLTVKENLLLGAYLRKDRIENDLEQIFGIFPILKERLNQTGGTLSGGEQQMLAIGRALMGRPRLLLLDEPSMGLAPLMVEKGVEAVPGGSGAVPQSRAAPPIVLGERIRDDRNVAKIRVLGRPLQRQIALVQIARAASA